MLSQSQQTMLNQTLMAIDFELRSDKQTIRDKALAKIQNILVHRTDDLTELLSNTNSNADITWSRLFDTAHESIVDAAGVLAATQDQRKLTTLKGKVGDKINIIQRIIALSCQDRVFRIGPKSVLEKAFQCFRHRTMVEYFGDCYLQIVTKHVLNAKMDLSEIKQEEWSELLNRCFQIYDHEFFTQKLILLQCITAIIDAGLAYAPLILELPKYIQKLRDMANDEHKSNAANEVYGIVYTFCKHLAADYRFAICDLTESVLAPIIKSYTKVADDTKILIAKLLHISLIVHHPEVSGQTSEYAANKVAWNVHIRNMMHLVQNEILRLRNNRLANAVVCEHFVSFASKMCSVAFWDSSVWETATSSEQPSKRRKQNDKLQGITDLIEIRPKVFCWRWLTILAQLLNDHPCRLIDEDFQPLLQQLFDFQSTIEHPVQIQTLRRIAEVLLAKESQFHASPLINREFCDGLWHKIAQNTSRSSVTNRPNLIENTKLLQTLVSHKQLPVPFIQSICETYLTSSIPRSNHSIRLLIAIYRNVGIDSLDHSERLRSDTLNWLHKTSMAIELKNISSSDVIDEQLKAELSVLCLFTKVDALKVDGGRTVAEPLSEHASHIRDIETKILFRCLKKMIFTRSIDEESKPHQPERPLPQPNQIRSIVNESYSRQFEAMLADIQITDNPFDDVINVVQSLRLFALILNELIAYRALDQKSLDASFFTKKIKFKVEQLDLCMIRLATGRYESKEKMEIIGKLLDVLNDTGHPLVAQIIKSQSLNSIVVWLSHIVNEHEERNSRCLLLKGYNQLKFEQKIRYQAFSLLCYLSDGDCEAFDTINDYEFNLLSNGDLCIVLHLIEVMGSRSKQQPQADWMSDHLKKLCMLHHKSNPISERIIDCIPVIVEYANPFDHMTGEMISIIRDFLKKIKKNRYSPRVGVKMMLNLKRIARSYARHFGTDEFENLLVQMKDFLKYPLYSMQFSVVDSLIHIFDKQWFGDGGAADATFTSAHLKLFQRKFFDFLFAEEDEIVDDADERDRYICVRGQLIIGLISSNFALRKESWFLLVELAVKHRLNADIIRTIVSTLCHHHKMDHDMLINENISYLVGEWLIRNRPLADFPWYFTTLKTQTDFYQANMNTTAICLLRHQPNELGDFASAMGRDRKSLMEAVLPDCLAYLTPILAGCDDLSERYRTNGTEMHRTLQESFGDLNEILRKQFLTVTENLLSNLWDANKFTEFFHLEIDYAPESHNIDMTAFTKSLDYLQLISESASKNVHLITDFCANRPLQIYNFLLFKRLQLQNTNYVDEQLVHLFQYCVVVDKVAAFFVSDAARPQSKKNILVHKKASLLRDIVYFIGNILNGPQLAVKLKLAACRYFRAFADQILPSCAQIFVKFLNFAVSSLIPLVQHDDRLLSESALECIRFLVMEQTESLAGEIALLDNFPQGDEFAQLRRVHAQIKYGGKSFSLTEEIDYFLKVDHRKIEGLAALKDQLSSKKNELIEMYNQLQHVHGFSEDCEKSLIHRLVFTLLQFVQGMDEAKAIEAAKCLGELGPSDLSSIVLKPDHQRHTYQFASTFDKAVEDLCTAAFTELNRLLLHPDAKVLKAASSSLIFLLKSEIGKNLLDDFPYLHLFQVPSTQKRKICSVPATRLDLEAIMMDDEHLGHSEWLKRLVKVLFDLFGDEHLQGVASLQSSFAETMLPLLIKMTLVSGHDDNKLSLQTAVLTFFKKHFDVTGTEPHSSNDQSIYVNKAIIKSMITVAECIRINNLNTISRITLEYMHIAKAAQYCEAYFTSVMYAELWALQIEASSQYTLAQIKSEPRLQEVMKKAYIAIGDMDAVSSFLDPISSRQTYLQLMNAHDKIALGMDVKLVNSPDSVNEFADHLHQSGLYALANSLSQKFNHKFECAWRLGDWNVLQAGATDPNDFQQEFERHHYIALKCLQTTKDEKGVKDALKTARQAVISSLKHLSLECTNNIYHHLERLTLLQQIDDFCQVQFEKPDVTVPNIFIKWKHQDGIQFTDFKYREPILAQRISIVKSAGVRAGRKLNSLFGERQDVIPTMLLTLASECRVEGNTNLAVRYLAQLKSVSSNSDVSMVKMLLEDAQLNWSIGNHLLSERILSSLQKGGDIESHFTRVISRRLLGEYKAESYSDSVETLIDKNFQHSLEMLNKLQENRSACVDKGYSGDFIDKFVRDNQASAYAAIAKYADREYNQICVHMKSTEFGTKKQTIAKNMETLAENGQIKASMSSDTKRALTIINANVNIDKREVQTIETEKSKFLLLAITNYVKICYLNDDFDDRTVFRIISLWFANRANAEVTALLRAELSKIATYKFVPALPQISARIANGDESFHRLIGDIMVRCATDHPQQTLYQLLALSNAYADDPAAHKSTKEPRVLGAAKILDKLKKDTKLRDIVQQMERMCSTLITLANVKMIGDRGKEHISSRDLTAFHSLSQLNLVHCPTLTLPISKDGQYNDLITVHSWAKKHELCGGINAPIKIACICSDGRTYDQLLKGKDDLRQDAVMQQVFTIMNSMLRSNKETRKRKLHIRTYRIVPLSQRSGILEWCANTITMNDYLTSSNTRKLGAHQRYFPNDLAPQKCRSTISSYRTQKKSIGEKLSEFKRICEQFHPVFHNYFFEKFPRPGMWFERRLAYTNSVAITSMIGYILGIGDRHISNILIDQTTAELIHIDFGIAFEQARVLPTPEKVPFRLTRDIVAGFGVSGVDGVFRKSCEKTMDVLRQNKSTIVTILEVLLYDPLHMWTLTRKEASKRQDVHAWATEEEATGDKKNVMAERALLRLQAKLNGQEEGLLTQQLTTEGQVDMLIKQAMNPLNWCQMFEGWQAYV